MVHKITVSHIVDNTLNLMKHRWFYWSFLTTVQSPFLSHFCPLLILSFLTPFSSFSTPSGIDWLHILFIQVTHKYSSVIISSSKPHTSFWMTYLKSPHDFITFKFKTKLASITSSLSTTYSPHPPKKANSHPFF